MRTLSSVMTKKVMSMTLDDTVLKAAKAMASKKISCVVIVNKNKEPIGIVTERDLSRKVVAKNITPSKLKLRDIMNSPVLTIDIRADFLGASEIMKKNNIRRLVVTKDSKLVGIITQTDLLRSATEFINSISSQINKVVSKL